VGAANTLSCYGKRNYCSIIMENKEDIVYIFYGQGVQMYFTQRAIAYTVKCTYPSA